MSDHKLTYIIRSRSGKSLSPFSLGKLLSQEIGTKCNEVKSTKLGYEIKLTAAQVEKLNKTTFGAEIEITKHLFRNKKKGVIFFPEFNYLSTDEILDGLKDENVKEIRRLLKKGPTKPHERENCPEKGLTNTGRYVMTFEKETLPAKLKVGLELVPVETYYPVPTQCSKCLKMDHHVSDCHKDTPQHCAKCSLLHAEAVCKAETLKCKNCSGEHHAKSRTCPVYMAEQKAINYAIDNNVPRFEARKLYRIREGVSYAQAAATAQPETTPINDQSKLIVLLEQMLKQQTLILNILTGNANGSQNTTAEIQPVQKIHKNPAQAHLKTLQDQLQKDQIRHDANNQQAQEQQRPEVVKRIHSPELPDTEAEEENNSSESNQQNEFKENGENNLKGKTSKKSRRKEKQQPRMDFDDTL